MSGNSASGSGGGLYASDGTTTLTTTTIRGNSATKGGGGLANSGGTTTLTNVTASGNTAGTNGGGLFDQGGMTTLTNSTLSGNSASSDGGGLDNLGGTATLTNVTVSGNSAGTDGGGLYTSGGMTTLIDVTVSGNSATSSGGGLDNLGGTATLTNVTVSGNSAGTDGGGLYTSGGTTTLNDVTVSGNSAISSGGGVDNLGGTTTLNNTIVAGQKAGGDISGVVSGSFNLIGTGGSGGLMSGVDGNLVGVANPGLAPLGSYGGPTQTMPLLYGSPAIGAGSDALVPAGITTDQTGSPRFFNGNVDIGAYELQVVIVPSFVVDITADYSDPTDGNTSLREAIASANVLPGHTITFDPTVFASAQTITLAGLQLDLSDTSGTETITAPAAGLTVSGGGLSRVFQVDAGVTASLSGLTITGGSAASGGGLYNDGGTTTLTNVTISGNTAGHKRRRTVEPGGHDHADRRDRQRQHRRRRRRRPVEPGGHDHADQRDHERQLRIRERRRPVRLGGTTTLTNVTVSGNSASVSGGGLYVSGSTTTLTNVTVSGNSASVSGGGLFNDGGATTLTNTIVAGQTAGGDISGTVSGSYNLIDTGGSGGLVNGVAGNIVGVADPGLAPLGNYGGPTQTMALMSGSAAINAGTTGAGIPTTDQRGFGRQGAVDIGAFQVGSEVVNTTAGGVLSSPGQLTLPQAVNLANVLSGAQTITFDNTVFKTPQTITLSGTQLELSNTTGTETITGPAAGLTVSGGGLSRVFQVNAPVAASISGLTITGGNSSNPGENGYGGGLEVYGAITLTNCTVSGNFAAYGGGGLATYRRRDHADQLHGQRQLGALRWWWPGQFRRRDGADQLHGQQQPAPMAVAWTTRAE